MQKSPLWRDRFPFRAVRPSLFEYEGGLRRIGEFTPLVAEAFARAKRMILERRPIVYTAGAVTGVDNRLKTRYEMAAGVLEKHGFLPYVPHLNGTDPNKNPEVDPRDIVNIDLLWGVVVSDMHVNFIFPPAANWAEQGWAHLAQVPTIYCLPSNFRLSRLMRGMHNIFATITYSSAEECLAKLATFAGLYLTWKRQHPNREIAEFFAQPLIKL